MLQYIMGTEVLSYYRAQARPLCCYVWELPNETGCRYGGVFSPESPRPQNKKFYIGCLYKINIKWH